jgi:hypothetical protein
VPGSLNNGLEKQPRSDPAVCRPRHRGRAELDAERLVIAQALRWFTATLPKLLRTAAVGWAFCSLEWQVLAEAV